ncbi:hypothetical protein H4R26_005657 [Coemansia thaxteri]|uniref:LITAF domain-containing protein n=1 Tax=Coemansia thaxteri TaxID=2663907 RepID=A0A9W8EFN2_9FUNG|nr:hypothetical protein H4R26_005657 [Coemansia thaxteri]
MDEKQRLAEADKASHAGISSEARGIPQQAAYSHDIGGGSSTTDIYADPPVYGSQAGPSQGATTLAAGAGQSPYGDHDSPRDNAPAQSPYGDYDRPRDNAPAQPPYGAAGGSWAAEHQAQAQAQVQGQSTVVDGTKGIHLSPGAYIEVKNVPANLTCPHCHVPIVTQIKTKTGTKTVVAAVAIALVFWPLAFIPFLSKRMKKSIHVCPHCKKDLGKVVSVTAVQPYTPYGKN